MWVPLPLKTFSLSIKANDSKVVNNGVKTFVDVANWEPFKSVAKLYVVLVISSRGAAEARSFLWAISISGPISHNFSPGFCVLPLAFLSYVRAKSYLGRELLWDETWYKVLRGKNPFTVACPKRQTSVLNGKSTFLSCFPTNLDDIWSDDGA